MRRLLQSSLLTVVSVLSAAGLNAQQNYNQTDSFRKYNSVWVFAPNAKLNFSTGGISVSAGLGGEEGCASVADPNTGALLFYSDGGKCWNSNNVVMPNGDGLLGNSTMGYSTAQGVCIVPIPGVSKKYYLFSLETIGGLSVKLYYSVVDMTLDNGLGDIVAGTKNTVLDNSNTLGESMLAIQGKNCDIWLMLHTSNTPTFKAYHITTTGINPNPVLSTTGGQIQGSTTLQFIGEVQAYEQSTLTISPNREKLALSCMHVASLGVFPVVSSTGNRNWGGLLCDFDAETGIVSNAILTDTLPQYSAAFSPDNSKLYYSTPFLGSNFNTPSRISQITISSNDSATIAASRTVIKDSINGGTTGKLIGMRTYNDSIYIVNPFALSLDRINQPNLAGTACNYQSNAISFPAAPYELGCTLPTEVVYAGRPDTVRSRILDTLVCNWGNGLRLRPANQALEDNYTWSNGTSDSTLTTMTSGTYWVKYGNSCHYRVDTFVVSGSDIEAIITVNVFQLGTTMPYSTYQWCLNNIPIAGATASTYTVTQNGAYTVVVSDGTCTDTSAVYNVTNVTDIDDLQHLGRQIHVYPNPTTDIVNIRAPFKVNVALTGIEGRTIRNLKDVKYISIGDLAAGVYLLRITDKDGTVLKVEKLIREK